MTIYSRYIYNPVVSLNETNKQFCLTTLKVIKASRPLFPLVLPSSIITGINIAEKSWDLKTKIHNFSKQYFSANKKNIRIRHLKRSNKRQLPFPKKKRSRSKNLDKNNFYIWPHVRDISLSGIALHTQIYKTFPGKIIGNLEKTVGNLTEIYRIYSKTEYSRNESEILKKEMLMLTTNILLLFVILSGYEQVMLPVHLLQVLTALLKAYIATNNEEYLAVYTQVLWMGISLLQINNFYEQFLKETVNARKII